MSTASPAICVNMPARLVIPVPKGVAMRDAACAPIAFSHRRAHAVRQRQAASPARPSWCRPAAPASARPRSRWRRRSAAPSSPRSATTTRSQKAKALGADHVINYRTERFETITRKLTNKKGVDVVFEHVGGEGFNGSLLVLKRGGRLVTCGSTAGPTHHLQPDAAVPAAVQNLRLVRRLDAQHPRQPRQDGGRAHARDRHRDRRSPISSAASRGWKAARCSARSSCMF